ncbi:gpW family head-tail joining protein [Herbaspirillum huttiense F1]|uniref:gpW family head-tail joining protein n=1 Tax=Herbaspirillum huttiense TaxID=863372 RepID=UPI0028879962|nr:gpW family head-tail joining protein [Herbaspirillum huttiense]MDT0355684.1 gpW family head-tail joining protein [Herbaspirillum huttiense F1]
MSNYDPATSDLANVPIDTLRQWQIDALQAMHDLSTGKKRVTISYSQGDGTRSVTYQQANIDDLRAWLAKLNAQLGLGSRRRPIWTNF